MRTSDSLVSVGLDSGSPCLWPTSRRATSSLRSLSTRPRRPCARVRSTCAGMDHRLPVLPDFLEESEGLPGAWVVLVLAPDTTYSAGSVPPSPSRSRRCCLHGGWPAGHPGWIYFVAGSNRAHSLACLRIADDVAVAVARLASVPRGLRFGRAGLPPAGRLLRISFDLPHVSLLPDQPCLVAATQNSAGVFWRLHGALAVSWKPIQSRDGSVRGVVGAI